jgi:hypothetical protein
MNIWKYITSLSHSLITKVTMDSQNNLNVVGSKNTKEPKQNNHNRLRYLMPGGVNLMLNNNYII